MKISDKKRVFDVLLSSVSIIALTPVLAALVVAVSVNNQGPFIFTQERIGKDNKPFRILKFKTMNDARDENGNMLPDNMRVNHFSMKLRKLGIDELPQLFNILSGQMSFVGPRPMVPEGPQSYPVPEERAAIRNIHPGLVGMVQLAKIRRGDDLPLKAMLRLDYDYAVSPPSILRDLGIMSSVLKELVLRRSNGSPLRTDNPVIDGKPTMGPPDMPPPQ